MDVGSPASKVGFSAAAGVSSKACCGRCAPGACSCATICCIPDKPTRSVKCCGVRCRGHIDPEARWKIRWDIVIAIITVFSLVETPYIICFGIASPSAARGLSWTDFVFDLLFLTDLFFRARTAFRVGFGELETDPTRILAHYARGWLVPDIISSFPVEIVLLVVDAASEGDGSGASQAVKFLRLLRIVRLLRIARILRMGGNAKYTHWVFLGRIVFTFLLFIHWAACFFFGCTYFEAWVLGIPYEEIEAGSLETWLSAAGMLGQPDGVIYATGMYWSVVTCLTIGYGDIAPKTLIERMYGIGVMMVGTVLYSLSFASLAALLSSLSGSESAYYEFMRQIDRYMSVREFPRELRRKVVEYFTIKYEWTRTHDAESFALLDKLPVLLQTQVAAATHRRTFDKNPLLRHVSVSFCQLLAVKLKTQMAVPGEVIFASGELATHVYVVSRGEIALVIRRAVLPLGMGLGAAGALGDAAGGLGGGSGGGGGDGGSSIVDMHLQGGGLTGTGSGRDGGAANALGSPRKSAGLLDGTSGGSGANPGLLSTPRRVRPSEAAIAAADTTARLRIAAAAATPATPRTSTRRSAAAGGGGSAAPTPRSPMSPNSAAGLASPSERMDSRRRDTLMKLYRTAREEADTGTSNPHPRVESVLRNAVHHHGHGHSHHGHHSSRGGDSHSVYSHSTYGHHGAGGHMDTHRSSGVHSIGAPGSVLSGGTVGGGTAGGDWSMSQRSSLAGGGHAGGRRPSPSPTRSGGRRRSTSPPASSSSASGSATGGYSSAGSAYGSTTASTGNPTLGNLMANPSAFGGFASPAGGATAAGGTLLLTQYADGSGAGGAAAAAAVGGATAGGSLLASIAGSQISQARSASASQRSTARGDQTSRGSSADVAVPDGAVIDAVRGSTLPPIAGVIEEPSAGSDTEDSSSDTGSTTPTAGAAASPTAASSSYSSANGAVSHGPSAASSVQPSPEASSSLAAQSLDAAPNAAARSKPAVPPLLLVSDAGSSGGDAASGEIAAVHPQGASVAAAPGPAAVLPPLDARLGSPSASSSAAAASTAANSSVDADASRRPPAPPPRIASPKPATAAVAASAAAGVTSQGQPSPRLAGIAPTPTAATATAATGQGTIGANSGTVGAADVPMVGGGGGGGRLQRMASTSNALQAQVASSTKTLGQLSKAQLTMLLASGSSGAAGPGSSIGGKAAGGGNRTTGGGGGAGGGAAGASRPHLRDLFAQGSAAATAAVAAAAAGGSAIVPIAPIAAAGTAAASGAGASKTPGLRGISIGPGSPLRRGVGAGGLGAGSASASFRLQPGAGGLLAGASIGLAGAGGAGAPALDLDALSPLPPAALGPAAGGGGGGSGAGGRGFGAQAAAAGGALFSGIAALVGGAAGRYGYGYGHGGGGGGGAYGSGGSALSFSDFGSFLGPDPRAAADDEYRLLSIAGVRKRSLDRAPTLQIRTARQERAHLHAVAALAAAMAPDDAILSWRRDGSMFGDEAVAAQAHADAASAGAAMRVAHISAAAGAVVGDATAGGSGGGSGVGAADGGTLAGDAGAAAAAAVGVLPSVSHIRGGLPPLPEGVTGRSDASAPLPVAPAHSDGSSSSARFFAPGESRQGDGGDGDMRPGGSVADGDGNDEDDEEEDVYHDITAVSTTFSEVLALPREDFVQLLDLFPADALAIQLIAAARHRMADSRMYYEDKDLTDRVLGKTTLGKRQR